VLLAGLAVTLGLTLEGLLTGVLYVLSLSALLATGLQRTGMRALARPNRPSAQPGDPGRRGEARWW